MQRFRKPKAEGGTRLCAFRIPEKLLRDIDAEAGRLKVSRALLVDLLLRDALADKARQSEGARAKLELDI